MDRRLMLMENFSPWGGGGLSAPDPGLYTYMYMTVIFKHL